MLKFKKYDFKQYNIGLLIVVIILGIIGAFLIKQVQVEGENIYIRHIAGLAGGIFLAVIVSLFDYHFICKFYIVLYGINLVLLFLVKAIGITKNNSQRWLTLGVQFQPSELTKIILIIFVAKLFTMVRQRINNVFVLLFSAIAIAVPTYFVLKQPNLSTSMVIMFIFVMMIFAAGLRWKVILPIFVIGIPCFFGLFWYIQQDYQVLLHDYQQERVLSILTPELYPETMFQQKNSISAIGSGQLYGKFFIDNDKDVRRYDSVPISESDFIFSVAGEEFGFIGSCIIIGLYAIIVYICLMTAKKAPDYMGMLIAVGIASMFMFQVFVNIGVATQLLPNTGIPLPFLSSGLSSLVSGMLAIGMILNIRLQPKKIRD
jgi:rod shape determining protein RodA